MERKEEFKEQFLEKYKNKLWFYLKFTKNKERADNVINGQLYVNPIKVLRDIEINQGIKGQGDSREVSLYSENVQVKLIPYETGELIPLDAKSIKFQYSDDERTPIFCLTGITTEDLIIHDYDDESITFHFPFSINDVEQLKKDFGEYVIMLSPEGFCDAIFNTLKKEKINGFFERVIYCDSNSAEKHEAFFSGSPRRFLYKDLEFTYQREYRLVLDEAITEGKFLNVGSLSDCATLFKVEDLLNGLIQMKYKIEEVEE